MRAHDDRRPSARGLRRPAKPARTAAHDLVQGEAAGDVQFGGEADLGVDDAVAREVEGALGGDAFERVPRLHHGDGVAKPSR